VKRLLLEPAAEPAPARAPEALPRAGITRPGDARAPMAGPFLASRLRALAARLEETGRRVLDEPAGEAVHDFRVAIRRTRTLLEIGRTIFGRFHADEVRGALTELQRATSILRDEEVLLGILESLHVEDPDVARWIVGRRRRERRLRSAVRRSIRRGALEHARTLLSALLAFRVKPSRERRLTKFARRAVGRAARELERNRAHSHDLEGLHRLRISYKRLRYTAEAFAEVLPRELGTGLARTASVFQARLGQVHDFDVAMACVERARGLHAGTRHALLAALRRLHTERLVSARTLLDGAAAAQPLSAYSGTDSLRKTSIR
jgi:CHAD domain-containing protein